ncbi:NUDIX domain-containing protein [Ruegeria atlantica]|uniref:NUDIX domain-containing protein n=1 Tax=Ruegeria atlantica TaxID=81569 RepID=UPI00147C1A88|nr:NUDIX hydrolase [Ruegeria atlantica]
MAENSTALSPTPIAVALVQHEERIVFIRKRGWPKGVLGLVSGVIKEGETPEAVALQEVERELGEKPNLVERIGVYPFEEQAQLLYVFFVLLTGSLCLGENSASATTIPINQLNTLDYGTGLSIGDWLSARKSKLDTRNL